MNVPCDGLWLCFSAGEMAAISRGQFIPRNSRLVIWRDKGNRVLREVMVGFMRRYWLLAGFTASDV